MRNFFSEPRNGVKKVKSTKTADGPMASRNYVSKMAAQFNGRNGTETLLWIKDQLCTTDGFKIC